MDTNYHDIIEKYLLGKLDETEKAEFEKQIATDDLLKEQLNIHREIQSQISSRAFVNAQIQSARGETEEPKSELDDAIVHQIKSRAFVDKQIESAKKPKKTIKLRTLYRRAISIAASILIIFSLFIELQKPSKEDFLSNYNYKTVIDGYQSHIDNNIERGISNTEEVAINLAVKNYADNNFEAVINILNKINSLETKEPKIYFIYACSNLNQGNYQIAIESLNQLLENKNIEFYDEVLYFSAIAYYMNNNSIKARKQIKKLKSKNSPILVDKESILSDMKLF